jgi:hypothetical protein
MRKSIILIVMVLMGINLSYAQQEASRPVVDQPVYFDISPPLRDMINLAPEKYDCSWKDGIVKNHFNVTPGAYQTSGIPNFRDPGLQDHFGVIIPDTTIQNFDGVGNVNGAVPPDTYGEVGSGHYFQVVNLSYAIYTKTGVKLLGPKANSSVWSGMPNNSNDGDAVVVFDEVANRWVFSQFSLPNTNGPFYQMIAVSQTSDPTGSWYRYQYSFTEMPDYPKFGVWPDGYYMSANRFTGSGNYMGIGAYAYDRTAMLAGSPTATRISFTLSSGNEAFGMLPSDCDGAFPPAGTPDYFIYINKAASNQHLGIYEFHADWNTPSNSTFGNYSSLPVNTFTMVSTGIAQLGTTRKLSTLGDRLMYRLQYRKFNGYSAMVVNHTVNAGANVAGVRWYELRNTGSAWSIYQQATYAPADNTSRWMASMAMDTAGTIAMGFSMSSLSMYPAIRYTGRFKNDPLNTMTMAEKTIINGAGCQTAGNNPGQTDGRWGDYSGMSVDPYSPTTFWFTTEYYQATSAASWSTRIGSFTFANVFSSSASAVPSTVCGGDSIQLKDVPYGGSGVYTYSWTSIPAGFTSTSKTPKAGPSDTTKYICAVSDGSITRHDTAQVNVVPPPSVYAGPDTLVCWFASKITLHGTASNYRVLGWATSGDGTFSSSSSPTTDYTFGTGDKATGHVDLKLIGIPNIPCSSNITSTRRVTFDPCSGIDEKSAGTLSIMIRPNPATESVTFTFDGLRDKSATFTITGMDGQTRYTGQVIPSGNKVTKQMDLTGFAKGIYLVQLKNDTQVSSQRLVIQ